MITVLLLLAALNTPRPATAQSQPQPQSQIPSKPPAPAAGATSPTSTPSAVLRPQRVEPLPGGLDRVPLLNDNNPELIRAPGILLSSFDPRRGFNGKPLAVPGAHLDLPLNGSFGLFSHHVYAGLPDRLDSTLWLAVVAAPRGTTPVNLRLVGGATALSQSPEGTEPSAPFLPLPSLMAQGSTAVWSGPGSRVATELLRRETAPGLPRSWSLAPGQLTPLLVLPLPVRGLDPLLNGRNLQLRLSSDGPVAVATLAAFGPNDRPPPAAVWAELLNGPLSPREHAPSPPGSPGPMVYSRVSGLQLGSRWSGRITDPGATTLSASRAPLSWPIASLERGSLGTAQVQTAPLSGFYPGTAWAAHGNYGVEYELTLPLRNDTAQPLRLQLAFEAPLKHDQPQGGLRFRPAAGEGSGPVVFRGTVEVSGLDGAGPGTGSGSGSGERPAGRQGFHVVQRAGQAGPVLGTVSLPPGGRRQLVVRLIYPADATPPQVLSLLPLPAVKQSPRTPASLP